MHFCRGGTLVDMSLNLHNSNMAVDHIVMVTVLISGAVSLALVRDWSIFFC